MDEMLHVYTQRMPDGRIYRTIGVWLDHVQAEAAKTAEWAKRQIREEYGPNASRIRDLLKRRRGR